MDTQNENTCYQGFTPNHPEPKSPLDFGQGEQTNQKLLVNLCITDKTRTTNVVRNAGCARSRYTLKMFFNLLMNQ